MEFATPQVGLMVNYRTMTFTVNGGRQWVSRGYQFPGVGTHIDAGRSDHVYVAAEHGMVYRYRVVPVEYTR